MCYTLFTAVAFMVSVVPIDVSQYAEDIAKNTVSHLSSNSPSTRDHAQQLFKALAKQSSDLRPVEQLSKLLFTALKSKQLYDRKAVPDMSVHSLSLSLSSR